MNTLHGLFAQRDQQAFQRLLERARNAASGSNTGSGQGGGRSWTKSSPTQRRSHFCDFDVNARDWLGRTVLHLACSSGEASAPQYVRLLLAYPGINVNVQDLESYWTPLHRALYNGNVITAALLLERSDLDVTVRDSEGNTAIDLYNSTVNYTKPSAVGTRSHVVGNRSATITELYTWGANRNATLGLGDGNDRVHPEHVQLYPAFKTKASSQLPSGIVQVGMSKLHTAVVTDDPTNSVRVCGFGLGGRLGQTQHTQYDFISIQIPQKIIKVALGQDHTLALTESREVMSWGLNRFYQLGYAVENADSIQPTARRITGPLRGKRINGVAACKTASVCWSGDELFAWGANNGQFGWNKEYNPVLASPKVVTKVDGPVVDIALSDSAMVCLGASGAVVCIWENRSIRIPLQLPNTAFPRASNAYTQTARFATIRKLSACDDIFGAVSTDGELFIFSLPESKSTSGGEKVAIRPQLVWALRKAFTAVNDFSMAAEGSIILCTESGHVFLRTRNPKAAQTGTKAFKFRRIPYIQRVNSVYGNNMGAFAALREDFVPNPICLIGNLLDEDLANLLPFWDKRPTRGDLFSTQENTAFDRADQEEESNSLGMDVLCMRALCDFLFPTSPEDPKSKIPGGTYNAPGADIAVRVQNGPEVLVHRCILVARSPVLASLLSGQIPMVRDVPSNFVIEVPSERSETYPRMTSLSIAGCHPISVLILLYYLYSDEVLAVWDPQVSRDVVDRMRVYGRINPHEVQSELGVLARILDFPLFVPSLQVVSKLAPERSSVKAFTRAFAAIQDQARRGMHKPDVILELADKTVYCHSTVLRARSEFFSAFFDDEDWARKRWTPEGTITIYLKHMNWKPMEFVLRFLCAGEDAEMFDSLDYINSADDLLNLMLEIISVSNELLIDRLNLICSSIILRHVNLNNVCVLYSEAVYYNLAELVARLEAYMVVNMEALVEYRMLGVLPYDLLKRISSAVRAEQVNKAPITRSSFFVDRAMEKYEDWLRLQDIPQLIVRTHPIKDRSETARRGVIPDGPTPMPMSRNVSEDIFAMDGVSSSPPVPPESPAIKGAPLKQSSGWKPVGPVIKHDMKSIIAETERNAFPQTPPKDASPTAKWTPRTPPRPERMPSTPGLPASSSLGKKVDLRMTPAVTQGSWTILSSDTKNSGLSITRPQGVNPVLGTTKPQSQSPPKALLSKPPTHLPPSSRTQNIQTSQPAIPVRMNVGSPSIRHTLSGGKPWANTSSNPTSSGQSSQGRVTSFTDIQSLQEEEKLPKGKQKQSLKEIQEEEQARAAEEDFLKWWAAEEDRLRKEEEEALRVAISMVEGESRGGGAGKRQHGRGGDRKSSRRKQQPERRSTGNK